MATAVWARSSTTRRLERVPAVDPVTQLFRYTVSIVAEQIKSHLKPMDLRMLVLVSRDARANWRIPCLPEPPPLLTLSHFVRSVPLLDWARQHGCPWDKRTTACAARQGNLTVLQRLRDNGCQWDYRTCQNAAEGGHLEVLRWAKENDCPWYYQGVKAAADRAVSVYGDTGVLGYLKECLRIRPRRT